MSRLQRLARRSRQRLLGLWPRLRTRRRRLWFRAWLGHLRPIVQVRPRQAPFFKALHTLLDREGETTLGELAEQAGEQTYGLLVLLLALPNLVPGLNVGTAPITGLAILGLGIQMSLGVPHPSLPARLQRQPLQKSLLKRTLIRLESYLERLGSRSGTRRALHQHWTGLVVAWTAFLLALPVPLPFGNLLPCGILVLLGAALLEERPLWGWIGTLASLGLTAYYAASYRIIAYACTRALHTLTHLMS
nr:exopolysaccharide biosynthesis protein [uncultured Holophaga sp.]